MIRPGLTPSEAGQLDAFYAGEHAKVFASVRHGLLVEIEYMRAMSCFKVFDDIIDEFEKRIQEASDGN